MLEHVDIFCLRNKLTHSEMEPQGIKLYQKDDDMFNK